MVEGGCGTHQFKRQFVGSSGKLLTIYFVVSGICRCLTVGASQSLSLLSGRDCRSAGAKHVISQSIPIDSALYFCGWSF